MENSMIPNSGGKYHQGKYELVNPEKYIGDPTNIVYRSSWELKFCVFADHNPRIQKWGSEILEIPYKDRNGRSKRYYPDFYIEMNDPDDPEKYERMVIEVKPMKETKPPQPPKNSNIKRLQSFEYQIKMYEKNLFKWEKAVEYCKQRDLKFFIVTEQHLNRMR